MHPFSFWRLNVPHRLKHAVLSWSRLTRLLKSLTQKLEPQKLDFVVTSLCALQYWLVNSNILSNIGCKLWLRFQKWTSRGNYQVFIWKGWLREKDLASRLPPGCHSIQLDGWGPLAPLKTSTRIQGSQLLFPLVFLILNLMSLEISY